MTLQGMLLEPSEIIDISVPIQSSLPRWPGEHNRFEHVYAKSMAAGDSMNVSRVSMGVHTGTHVDAPVHHFQDGAGIDEVRLRDLMGSATVHDLTQVTDCIRASDLQGLRLAPEAINLFKTRNSRLWSLERFEPNYVWVAPDAAEYLVSCRVAVIGMDYLSVERFAAQDGPTHKILLEAGVIIVEGLNLDGVEAGRYGFACLPLPIVGAEAAPARAILIRWT